MSLRWTCHTKTPEMRGCEWLTISGVAHTRQGYEARRASRSDSDAALRGRDQRLEIRSKLTADCCCQRFRNRLDWAGNRTGLRLSPNTV